MISLFTQLLVLVDISDQSSSSDEETSEVKVALGQLDSLAVIEEK